MWGQWSKANEVYIQNLISIEYTSADWLSVVLVITIIRSGKQIGSKLPKNGVCIERVLNSTSFKKTWIIHKNLRTSTLVSNKSLATPPHSCWFQQQLVATFASVSSYRCKYYLPGRSRLWSTLSLLWPVFSLSDISGSAGIPSWSLPYFSDTLCQLQTPPPWTSKKLVININT